jgi:hypothetical protein
LGYWYWIGSLLSQRKPPYLLPGALLPKPVLYRVLGFRISNVLKRDEYVLTRWYVGNNGYNINNNPAHHGLPTDWYHS